MATHYLKTAFKVLLRRKFFTFISLFAISFTLVVLMTATAILDHLFAPMGPETRQERTLIVYRMEEKGPHSTWNSSAGYGFLDNYTRNIPNVERWSAFTRSEQVSSYKNGYEIRPYVKYTDGEFWKILDFTFLEGGPFTNDDDRSANFVAVINTTTREKFFGSGPAVGRFIELDRRAFRVIGVVADVPIFRQTPFSDVWVPIGTYPVASFRTQLMGPFHTMLLARSSADFPAIKAEFKSRLKNVQFPDRNYTEMRGVPQTYFESVSSDITDAPPGDEHPAIFLGILFAAMLLFMLLPAINLININISRIIERASEIGVRKSFGASSMTLIGQFIVENVLLTFIGGIIGFILSLVVLNMVTSADLFPYAEFHLNYRIFLYGLLLILFFGLLSGVYPAWKMSRMHPVNALKGVVR